MTRKRTNDPLGLSDNPACVTDPVREAELLAEFRRRLAYLRRHYRAGRIIYGDVTDYNDAVRALKRTAEGKPARGGKYRRLLPMIELAVSMNARRFARERTGDPGATVEGEDIRRASIHVAGHLDPICHRPPAKNLIHHVEGLMVLVQDTTGKPVVPRRYRNSVYDPHFKAGASELVPLIFRELEPSVTIGQLVTIAENARRAWAGRRPQFEEYFPGYGLRAKPDGSFASDSGLVIEPPEPNIPTYFH